MSFRGYERYKCKVCGKRCRKKIAHYIYFCPEYHDCCSKECLEVHLKEVEEQRLSEKAKKDAEFITRVAKEVLRLQKEEG